MTKTLEERITSICTDLLLEQCRETDGYVNKKLLNEAEVDLVIDATAYFLFKDRAFDRAKVKADLIRFHLQ